MGLIQAIDAGGRMAKRVWDKDQDVEEANALGSRFRQAHALEVAKNDEFNRKAKRVEDQQEAKFAINAIAMEAEKLKGLKPGSPEYKAQATKVQGMSGALMKNPVGFKYMEYINGSPMSKRDSDQPEQSRAPMNEVDMQFMPKGIENSRGGFDSQGNPLKEGDAAFMFHDAGVGEQDGKPNYLTPREGGSTTGKNNMPRISSVDDIILATKAFNTIDPSVYMTRESHGDYVESIANEHFPTGGNGDSPEAEYIRSTLDGLKTERAGLGQQPPSPSRPSSTTQPNNWVETRDTKPGPLASKPQEYATDTDRDFATGLGKEAQKAIDNQYAQKRMISGGGITGGRIGVTGHRTPAPITDTKQVVSANDSIIEYAGAAGTDALPMITKQIKTIEDQIQKIDSRAPKKGLFGTDVGSETFREKKAKNDDAMKLLHREVSRLQKAAGIDTVGPDDKAMTGEKGIIKPSDVNTVAKQYASIDKSIAYLTRELKYVTGKKKYDMEQAKNIFIATQKMGMKMDAKDYGELATHGDIEYLRHQEADNRSAYYKSMTENNKSKQAVKLKDMRVKLNKEYTDRKYSIVKDFRDTAFKKDKQFGQYYTSDGWANFQQQAISEGLMENFDVRPEELMKIAGVYMQTGGKGTIDEAYTANKLVREGLSHYGEELPKKTAVFYDKMKGVMSATGVQGAYVFEDALELAKIAIEESGGKLSKHEALIKVLTEDVNGTANYVMQSQQRRRNR